MKLYEDNKFEVYGTTEYKNNYDLRIQVINRKAYAGVKDATPCQLEFGQDRVVNVYRTDDSPMSRKIAEGLWEGKGRIIRKGKVE